MLCNRYIERIPVEGLNGDGTCCIGVACIENDSLLCTGWISPSARTECLGGGVCSWSWSLSDVVSKERRGRRYLALALPRHMVGRDESDRLER